MNFAQMFLGGMVMLTVMACIALVLTGIIYALSDTQKKENI